MPYQPTGKPAGRPRKDGLPPGSVKEQAKPVETPAEPELEPEPGMSKPGPFVICRLCYPDGWPKGATGLGCRHGIWSRPWVG